MARASARSCAGLECAPSHVRITQSEIRPTLNRQPAEGKGAAGSISNTSLTSYEIERAVGPTFVHSAATCLHVPTKLTRESTKHEGRKPRASERHTVGCCDELGGLCPSHSSRLRCT